jgi:hypothetical protein
MSTTVTSNSTLTTIEQDASVAGTVAAAVGGPTGVAIDAGIQGAEALANTVAAAVANHGTVVQDVVAGAQSLVTNAPTIAAAVDPAKAGAVTGIATAAQSFLSTIEGFLAELGIKV